MQLMQLNIEKSQRAKCSCFFKKALLLLLGIVLTPVLIYAQGEENKVINWGEEYKMPVKSYFSGLIGANEKYCFTLRRKSSLASANNQIIVEKFDVNSCKLIDANAINLKFNKKPRVFEKVLYIQSKMYLITSYHNKAKKKNYLFAQEIKDNLQLSEKLIKIGEIDVDNLDREGSFDIKMSRDSSKVLVYYDLPHKSGGNEKLALNVFDSSFNELWNKKIELPYSDKQFIVEKYKVDNFGNVYMLCVRFFDGTKYRRKGKPNYEYLLLSYYENGDQNSSYSFGDKHKFLTDLTFEPLTKGTIVCAGFYSEKNSFSIKGIFFFRVNILQDEILAKNFKEFDFDFLTYHYTDNQKERAEKASIKNDKAKEPELYRYDLGDLILRSDQGVVMIAEQYFVREYSNFGNNGWNTFNNNPYLNNNRNISYVYNYNDIIVININPEGEIIWTSSIPKRQVTTNDGGYYSSYAKAAVRDKIYLIFNDNHRNFDERTERQHNFDGRNSVIALTTVSKKGESLTESVFFNEEANVMTRPKVCKQVGKSKMIIYGESNKHFRFGLLDFK